jgi:putative MATE family efflux protein
MNTKAIFDRVFLKRLLKLSAPIILQNLFTVLGSSATTLLTGRLGDRAIASAGLLRQFTFMLSIVQFGVSTGCAIFTAQFWGKSDKTSIHKTLGVALLLGSAVSLIFTCVALVAPGIYLRLFTNDAEVLAISAKLLRIAGASFLFLPLTYAYTHILRTTGDMRLPMLASIMGVIINLVLGYGLIFGKLGLPDLGVYGAAAANLVGRIAEATLLVWLIYHFKTPLAARFRDLFAFDRPFFQKVMRRVLPVISNEFIWGLGINAYGVIYARMGTEAYAAVTIKDSIENLLFVPFLGITSACAVLIGNTIGAGKPEKAQNYVRQTFLFMAGVGLALGSALYLLRRPMIGLFNISNQSRTLALQLLSVLAAALWLRGSNFVFFIGMMRSGGDTRFAYLMDAGAMWGLGVPLALLGAFVLQLPVHQVYMLVMGEEAVKFLASLWRFRSKRWIHDLAGG